MDNDIFELNPRHYGILNRDKKIFYIELGDNVCGFFAVYRLLLELLYLADVCGMTPVVKYKKEFLYSENDGNPFEYYFRQPSGIGIVQAKNSYNVIKAKRLHNNMVELVFNGSCGVYDAKPLYIMQMAEMQRKYIRLQPRIKEYIDDGINRLIGGANVLGVHMRGTDFKKNYNIHPRYIEEEQYIEEIKKQLACNKWDKIFLATDDENVLKKCRNVFGNKVVFYKDVFRSKTEKSVAFSNSGRKDHKYMLGAEVLRDAYTLAACNGLIAGVSQVSICARIIRIAEFGDYEHIRILNQGYNKNNRIFRPNIGDKKGYSVINKIDNFIRRRKK